MIDALIANSRLTLRRVFDGANDQRVIRHLLVPDHIQGRADRTHVLVAEVSLVKCRVCLAVACFLPGEGVSALLTTFAEYLMPEGHSFPKIAFAC